MNIKYSRGVEGNSLYINDTRVSGPKPWGGGDLIKEWTILDKRDLERIVKEIKKELQEEIEK